MREVSGLTCPGRPARLTDYQRLSLQGEPYPALIPQSGTSIEGILYADITTTAWRRLDDFEGDMYERKQVTVVLFDGSSQSAHTYVLRKDYFDLLANDEWDFTAFLADGKRQFESEYKGYHAIPSTGGSECKP